MNAVQDVESSSPPSRLCIHQVEQHGSNPGSESFEWPIVDGGLFRIGKENRTIVSELLLKGHSSMHALALVVMEDLYATITTCLTLGG